jgi:hypothetical protein
VVLWRAVWRAFGHVIEKEHFAVGLRDKLPIRIDGLKRQPFRGVVEARDDAESAVLLESR